MNTTVTAVFPSQQLASLAAVKLVHAGVPADQVEVVDVSEFRRHGLSDKTPATRPGIVLAVLVGAAGGGMAGALFTARLGLLPTSLLGSLFGAAGGALLGFWLGRTKTTQTRTALENEVDAHTLLVSVTVAAERKRILMDLLAGTPGNRMVMNSIAFTSGAVTSGAVTSGVRPDHADHGRPAVIARDG